MDFNAAAKDPNVRAFLDMLSNTEGTTKYGYNTAFGGRRLASLAAHPGTAQSFKQTDNKSNVTTAAGRYQFLNRTWNDAREALNKQGYDIKDFGPHAQDLAAIYLMQKRGALGDVLKGDWHTAINKLGKEWASLPSSTYKQPKASWNKTLSYLPGGDNFTQSTTQGMYARQGAEQQPPNQTDAAPTAVNPLEGAPAPTPAPAITDLVAGLVPQQQSPQAWQDVVNTVQQQPEEPDNPFIASAIDNAADQAHHDAVARFMGQDSAPPNIILPKAIEDQLNKYMAELT